jgi:high-affinity Fe2+/Pb2+ permease
MKNPFSFLGFGKFRENTAIAFTRFPIAIALSAGIAAMFFVLLHGTLDTGIESILHRMILSAVATFFFSVGVSLHTESHTTSRLQNYLFQFVPVAF